MYMVASVALFGWNVIANPAKTSIGSGGDPAAFAWFVAWWPHAITQFNNPMTLDAAFAPHGIPAASTTSIPALSALASMITVSAGPVVSTNVLFLVAPAASAFTAYLLCLEITGRITPALIGGYLYGFSTYVASHMLGHLNLAFTPWLPLLAVICIRVARQETSHWRGVIVFSVIAALQLGTSTEMALQTAIFGAIALALIALLAPEFRAGARRASRTAIQGFIGAAVLASPLLVQQFVTVDTGWHPARRADSQDLLSLVVPDPSLIFHAGDSISAAFTSGLAERGLYISIFGVALLAIFAWSARGTSLGRVLPVLAIVTGILALGPLLHIAGHELPIPLPAAAFIPLPIFELMITGRFGVFLSLCLAITAAIALAHPHMWRWALPLATLTVVACLPSPTFPLRWSDASTPAGLASHSGSLIRGENVVTLPTDAGMRWQAVSGFTYVQTGGYTGVILPRDYRPWRDVLDGLAGRTALPAPERFKTFTRTFRTSAIVVGPGAPPGANEMLTAAGFVGVPNEEVVVWREPPSLPDR
jgi:hypothetical protein